MFDDLEFSGRIKPKNLTEKEEAQRYLDLGQSKVVRSKEDLQNLMDRGEVFTAAQLADKQLAEKEAKRQFELAAEIESRNQRFQSPRPTTKYISPVWTRGPIDE
jgi:hypothetical protein